jgi:hypothetical protein
LPVTSFPGEQDTRITDVFGRINSGGKQLSDQERRQAGVLSPFAEMVRTLAAEIRGDVSRETLLLSEMPEISIETSRNPHGYALKAEDIFWCYQGIPRALRPLKRSPTTDARCAHPKATARASTGRGRHAKADWRRPPLSQDGSARGGNLLGA